ncbi:LysM peptidoglycan-binding domain-containing protein [Candidatus Saccharibacteria bacterium]|nr:MAG: LysM peptidoglycan-binding domain-containing protein [Candidatus Saccharibacteria bacterium]
MRKTVLSAVAFATVLCGVTMPRVSAQSLGSYQEKDFVKTVILASNDEKNPNEVKQTEEKKADEVKPAVASEPAAPAPVVVTVQPGDSLSKIAEAHGTTWTRLYFANTAIGNPNIINPGEQIRVPSADEVLAERPLPQPVVVAAPVATAYRATTYRAAAAPATSYPVSANAAKAYIYSRESGNNPNATNPGGCYGIGQDCNGVLRSSCGADYACQDAYFEGYAARRYGSWEAAYAFGKPTTGGRIWEKHARPYPL